MLDKKSNFERSLTQLSPASTYVVVGLWISLSNAVVDRHSICGGGYGEWLETKSCWGTLVFLFYISCVTSI
jgi:hypothetical protein